MMNMNRLSTLDANFLYLESSETPMHVAGLCIFASPPSRNDFFDRFRVDVAARLHLLPYFKRRLSATPATIENPVWIAEEQIDLDYHIQRMALPRPGTIEQLRTLVAQLHMILLDWSRPLWQYTVIEGLEHGGVAVYRKIHHCAIDGPSGEASLEVIFSSSPDPVLIQPAPATAPSRTVEPGLLKQVLESYGELWRRQGRIIGTVPDFTEALANIGLRLIEDLVHPPNTLILPPKTIFNVSVSNQTQFRYVSATAVRSEGRRQDCQCQGQRCRYGGLRRCAASLSSGAPRDAQRAADRRRASLSA